VTLSVNGTGQLLPGTGSDEVNALLLRQENNGGVRLQQNLARVSNPNPRFFFGAPAGAYITADVNATHTFSGNVDGVVQVLNLGDRYRNDLDYGTSTLGRQTKAGVRIRF
jgi:hypothetical protein